MILERAVMKHFLLALVTVAVVIVAQVACDKVPLTSPTGSTISIAVDKSIVPINGQATVVATVIESAGTAVHNGTVVTFMATAGSYTQAEVQTVNGRAVTTYLAPNISTSATLNAFSGAASTGSGNSSSGGVTVLVGSAAVGTGGVSISVAPATVPQNGGTVTVSARVLDTGNNPLAGVGVIFSTDQGTLANTTAVTDSTGSASTQLTTNRVTKVTATVGAQKADFIVNVITAPTVSIALASSTAATVVGTPIAFTVTPSSAATSNPIQSVMVDYGDGQRETKTGVTGPVGFVHTYSRADGYTVTATATDINGVTGVSSTSIVVTRPSSPTIEFTQPSASATQPAVPAIPESFRVVATPGTGVTITSIIVRRQNGEILYNQSGGGTFAASVTANEILTATATDSAGGTAISQIVVQ